jgi:hypothetical protein
LIPENAVYQDGASENATTMPRRKYANPEVYAYLQNLKSYVATTRFSNQTWDENQAFLARARADGKLPAATQCMYPCSVAIGETVPISANVFVLEMNNETNHILGIGLIKNHPPHFHRFQVYQEERYNTYTYQGAYRIDREKMDEHELGVLRRMETACFKGARHQKRMAGIKLFPRDMLYDMVTQEGLDVTAEITAMFKTRFLTG